MTSTLRLLVRSTFGSQPADSRAASTSRRPRARSMRAYSTLRIEDCGLRIYWRLLIAWSFADCGFILGLLARWLRQSPITNHQSPITNHQSPITNHQSSINPHSAIRNPQSEGFHLDPLERLFL